MKNRKSRNKMKQRVKAEKKKKTKKKRENKEEEKKIHPREIQIVGSRNQNLTDKTYCPRSPWFCETF